jgi:transcriptional regulator with XRE-family HTH domain
MVAERIRERRAEMGLSQLELATLLGISLQQVSKYESGTNRVSAARLYAIAQVLEVSVGWFFREERRVDR